MDETFSEETIDGVLSKKIQLDHESIKTKILALARQLPGEVETKKPETPEYFSWIGDVRSKSGCHDFLGAIHFLLEEKKPGLALYGNFIDNVQDAERIPTAENERLVVLAKLEPMAEKAIEIKKKQLPRRPRAFLKKRRTSPTETKTYSALTS